MRTLDMRIQNLQVDNSFCDGRRKRKREKNPQKNENTGH
jgi:hypothetical protein